MDVKRFTFLVEGRCKRIHWDKERNLWFSFPDSLGKQHPLAAGSSVRETIDRSFYGKPKEYYSYNDIDGFFSKRMNFLERKIFNLIKFDDIIGQWIIGDLETGIGASIDRDICKAIDRLLGYK